MMLRSRSSTNVANANNIIAKPGDAAAKRGAKKTHTDEKDQGEPKAKRAAFTDLSQVLSNRLVIDSSKKEVAPVKRTSQRSNSASDSLPRIEETVEPTESFVDPCPGFDFDADNLNDQFAVSQFACDIFRYYRSREKEFMVDDYMSRQPHIKKENRAALMDWMVEIQETFELNHETLYLSVKLVDLFLSREQIQMDETQIVACCAMFIASKFDERSPPLIDDFIYMAEDSFDRNAFIKMEMRMLKVVGFDLGSPLSYRYVRRYARVVKQDMQTLTLARYILETSLMFYEMCGVSESRIAAAAFLLALKMKDTKAEWSPALHKYSGYREDEIEALMWELNHMLHVRSKGNYARLQTVFAKYSHEVFYHSAAVPLLPNKFPATRPVQAPEGEGFGRLV